MIGKWAPCTHHKSLSLFVGEKKERNNKLEITTELSYFQHLQVKLRE